MSSSPNLKTPPTTHTHSYTTEKRQTVLFSATQTRNVEDLARISLKKAPRYVGVDDHKETATVDGLEQVSRDGTSDIILM